MKNENAEQIFDLNKKHSILKKNFKYSSTIKIKQT